MNPEDGKGEGELILYRTEDGRDALQLRLVDGTVWLTQATSRPSLPMRNWPRGQLSRIP
jgi:hypothetical protein